MFKQHFCFFFSCAGYFLEVSAGDFHRAVDLTWSDHRAHQILDGGKQLTVTLDKTSGSGFRSKREYLSGGIDMELKLGAGDSAGTVTAYYVYVNLHIYLSLWAYV
ncbi:hypothetical protein Ddye_024434 [Dipteronia dyeriana]|uniref:GH16 domain-containing protein n=1 Tax=Dipteronia dyeriana TaxID=168575 RepID=A0AAD9TUZ8_9ROSI|nr:hypothetical protein Ddye_024434 [Dipteronia dyeriana]